MTHPTGGRLDGLPLETVGHGSQRWIDGTTAGEEARIGPYALALGLLIFTLVNVIILLGDRPSGRRLAGRLLINSPNIGSIS